MNYRFKSVFTALSLVFIAAILVLVSCGDKATNGPGLFDVYGRIAFRPFEAGLPLAEFYIYHNGEPVTDARIVVRGDTVPALLSEAGHYYREINFRIGDTLSYSIASQYGADQGSVIIPDTITIINPRSAELIYSGEDYAALWHKGYFVDGYFSYFKRQNGYAALIKDISLDTSGIFAGQNIINIGIDTFWVETLRGSYNAETAPNGRIMPRGVVGAAGNYRNVEITIAPPLGKER